LIVTCYIIQFVLHEKRSVIHIATIKAYA